MARLDLGVCDPRVRSYVLPTRIVWQSGSGVSNPEALLQDDDRVCVMTPQRGGAPPSLLLDFGRELHGGIRVECPTTSTGRRARVRIRFGESVTEAMSEPNNDHTIHDLEAWLPWMGHQEYGNTGFRFVRIDLLDEETEVHVRASRAVFVRHDVDWAGSFECDDARLNEIWRVGAYTVQLCMQDLVWDGIKRDRLPWIGDLHPEAMVVSAVFGEDPLVPATLDYVRDHTPLPGWMNGISSYSLWWILCHRDWWRWHGNRAYLAEQTPYLLGLLDQVAGEVGPDGQERLSGHRFLEWPTARDQTAIACGLQALIVLSLRAGGELCEALGLAEPAARALEAAERAAGGPLVASPSKQANALAALAGLLDAGEVNREVLLPDAARGLSTFYGYYVLEARALAGDYAGSLDLIRTYWGAMLDRGATSFWEALDLDWLEGSGRIDEITPPGLRDLHADHGDHCYVGLRHSLCHGWAAGPTAWLTEHVLGIRPNEPGFASVRIEPNLASLEWARGTVPTPHGIIEVSHTRTANGELRSEVRLPEGVALA